MSRAVLTIAGMVERRRAHAWIDQAPINSRLELKAPRRSSDQSALMWVWLTAIASKVDWHGQRYSPDDWKDYMMHALRRARWMPNEDGGMVPIGMRTSDLSRQEMGDLLEVIAEFATRHGVSLPEREHAA